MSLQLQRASYAASSSAQRPGHDLEELLAGPESHRVNGGRVLAQDELFVARFPVGEKLRAIRKQSTVPNLKVGHGHPLAGCSVDRVAADVRRPRHQLNVGVPDT